MGALENSRSKKISRIHVAKSGSDTNNGTENNPFLTISKGTAVASKGDTVLVGPGTYFENIVLLDADLHLASYYLTTGERSYVDTTFIDGQQNGSTIWARSSNKTILQIGLPVLKLPDLLSPDGGANGTVGSPNGAGVRMEHGKSFVSDQMVISDNLGRHGGGISGTVLDKLTIRKSHVHSNRQKNMAEESRQSSLKNSILRIV